MSPHAGRTNRPVVTDNLSYGTAEHIHVGSAFAFLAEPVFDSPGLRWIGRMMPKAPRILSLVANGPVELPGVRMDGIGLPYPRLAGMLTDRTVYRQGIETVNLLIFDLQAADRTFELEILANGEVHMRLPVQLNEYGVAAVCLTDLPGAHYDVALLREPRYDPGPLDEGTPTCAFTVAENRFSLLTASIAAFELDDTGSFRLSLRLENAGRPVDGPVRFEVSVGNTRSAAAQAAAENGTLNVSIPLAGDGHLAIHLQLADDPSRTATVPISATRVATAMARFSRTDSVRSFWLPPRADTLPFVLQRIDARVVRLTARAGLSPVRIVVMDATVPSAESHSRPLPREEEEELRKGEALLDGGKIAEALEIFKRRREATRAAAFAYAIACCHARARRRHPAVAWLRAAIEDGWSDLGRMAADARLDALRGHAPFEALCSGGTREFLFDAIPQGHSVEFDVDAPISVIAVGAFEGKTPWEGYAAVVSLEGPAPAVRLPERIVPGTDVTIDVECGNAAVWMVVREARPGDAAAPMDVLVDRTSSLLDSVSRTLRVGQVREKLSTLIAPEPHVVYAPPSPIPSAAPAAAPAPVHAPAGLRERAYGVAPRGRPTLPTTTVQEPDILFAGLVPSVDGRASVTVRLGPVPADYVVEAHVFREARSAPVRVPFRAEARPFVALDVPELVHPLDGAIGRVIVGAGPGAIVRVLHNGVELKVRDGTFQAGEPGDYSAIVEDAGLRAVAERHADQIGKLRCTTRTVRLLEKGAVIMRTPDIIGLRALPGFGQPFLALLQATADCTVPDDEYDVDSCEPVAARVVAACALIASARNAAQRSKAEAIVIDGVKRLDRHLRHFDLQKAWGDTDRHRAMAARHLLSLALGSDPGSSPALRKAIASGIETATAVFKTRRPQPSTCEEAYAAVRFGDAAAQEAAIAFVRGHLRPAEPKKLGAVRVRAELAYAAAVLLRAGDPDPARALANEVFAAIRPTGRLYSTIDSTAAIVLLRELSEAGIAGAAEVDGRPANVTDLIDAKESVRCTSGTLLVEIVRIVEEDWLSFQWNVPLQVALQRAGKDARNFKVGEPLDLRVKRLDDGYCGDEAWIGLPPALVRANGGSHSRRFSVAFKRGEVVVPLVAVAPTTSKDGKPGPVHYAVCLRNGFVEERVGSPGVLGMMVT